jgi:type I restriction enzyme S subunit
MAEQEAIVAYLDGATAEIDKAIASQQHMVELLQERKQIIIESAVTKGIDSNAEFKDSGLKYLGLIPNTWNTIRLGYCSWIRARLGWKGLTADEYVDEGYPFLSAFNIINNLLVWSPLNFISKFRFDESPEIKLRVGDILLVKDGAGIGKCARVDDLPCGEATANGSLAFITPDDTFDYRYLYYFLISNCFKQFTELLINGQGVPHLTQEVLKRVRVPRPPKEIQVRIVEQLDKAVKEINASIASCDVIINKLQERKQILINDVVTGKIKIL